MTSLASLPFERYQSLIVSLDVAGEDSLSFNNVKALLLNEADRLADSNTESQRVVANFASATKLKPKPKWHFKCYACGKKGILQRIVKLHKRKKRMHHMNQDILKLMPKLPKLQRMKVKELHLLKLQQAIISK